MKTLTDTTTNLWERYTSLGALNITLSVILLLSLVAFATVVFLKKRKEERRRIEHNRKHMNGRLKNHTAKQRDN